MVEKRVPKESISEQMGASDYITARRERGKLAQRAFRQRQIDTIRSLEDENQKLRDVISTICDAVGKDTPTLSEAILKARKAAGMPIAEVQNQPSAPVAVSSDDSGWSSCDSNDGITNPTPTRSPDDENLDSMTPVFDGNESNDMWMQLLSTENTTTYTPSYVPSGDLKILDTGVDMSMLGSMYPGGQISSSVIPTTWPDADRSLQLVDPPPDIIPYMGKGAYTLAGQLYWTAMAFGFQAIRTLMSSPSPPAAAVDIVTATFTYTMRHIALSQIMQMMHARLLFRRHGYLQHPANSGSADERHYWSQALDPKVTTNLGANLGRDFQRAGIQKDDFLTPLDIERCVRDRFLDDYPILEDTLKGQARAEEHVVCMRRLMQIMSRDSICFGDGPRWRQESVETLINTWEMSTSPVAVS